MEVFELIGPDKTDCEMPDIGMGQLLYNSFSEQGPEKLLLVGSFIFRVGCIFLCRLKATLIEE